MEKLVLRHDEEPAEVSLINYDEAMQIRPTAGSRILYRSISPSPWRETEAQAGWAMIPSITEIQTGLMPSIMMKSKVISQVW